MNKLKRVKSSLFFISTFFIFLNFSQQAFALKKAIDLELSLTFQKPSTQVYSFKFSGSQKEWITAENPIIIETLSLNKNPSETVKKLKYVCQVQGEFEEVLLTQKSSQTLKAQLKISCQDQIQPEIKNSLSQILDILVAMNDFKSFKRSVIVHKNLPQADLQVVNLNL